MALGDVGADPAVAGELAGSVERRPARDAPVVAVALGVEAAEQQACIGPPRFVVGDMLLHGEADRLDRPFPAPLADRVARSRPAALLAFDDQAQAQLPVHLPVPVGRHFRQFAQAALAVAKIVLDAPDIGQGFEHHQRAPNGEIAQVQPESGGAVPGRLLVGSLAQIAGQYLPQLGGGLRSAGARAPVEKVLARAPVRPPAGIDRHHRAAGVDHARRPRQCVDLQADV